jgi:hypothetical protein
VPAKISYTHNDVIITISIIIIILFHVFVYCGRYLQRWIEDEKIQITINGGKHLHTRTKQQLEINFNDGGGGLTKIVIRIEQEIIGVHKTILTVRVPNCNVYN